MEDNNKYGHLFDSKVPDIDFKEIMDKNKVLYVTLPEKIDANDFGNVLRMVEQVVIGIEAQRK
jgi:hypothetical protein